MSVTHGAAFTNAVNSVTLIMFCVSISDSFYMNIMLYAAYYTVFNYYSHINESVQVGTNVLLARLITH